MQYLKSFWLACTVPTLLPAKVDTLPAKGTLNRFRGSFTTTDLYLFVALIPILGL